MQDTAERVRSLVCEHLGVEPAIVTDAATFSGDLGADSLDRVELTMAAEQAFGVCIDDGEAEEVKTVAEFVTLVDRKRWQQTASV